MKLTSMQKFFLGKAIQELTEALIYDGEDGQVADIRINAALNQIGYCRAEGHPWEYNQLEADVSAVFHTYLRKKCDSDLSILLYDFKQKDIGDAVWLDFIRNWGNPIERLERKSSYGPQDMWMYHVIRAWAAENNNYSHAVEWMKANG